MNKKNKKCYFVLKLNVGRDVLVVMGYLGVSETLFHSVLDMCYMF